MSNGQSNIQRISNRLCTRNIGRSTSIQLHFSSVRGHILSSYNDFTSITSIVFSRKYILCILHLFRQNGLQSPKWPPSILGHFSKALGPFLIILQTIYSINISKKARKASLRISNEYQISNIKKTSQVP